MSPSKASKEVSKSKRLQLAIEKYKQAYLLYENSSNPHKKQSKVESITREYNIIFITLSRRLIEKTRTHRKAYNSELRLSPIKEKALKE